jgi:hypothetical protein
MRQQKNRPQQLQYESEIQLLRRMFISSAYSIKKDYLIKILSCSKANNINVDILFSILIIEKMNRGDLWSRILERTAAFISPKLVIKLDLSIGLGQIKISTAQKVSNVPPQKLIIDLLKPELNIEIVSRLLSIYNEQTAGDSNQIKKMVNLYTTGKKEVENNTQLILYIQLVNWCVSQKVFSKVLSV